MYIEIEKGARWSFREMQQLDENFKDLQDLLQAGGYEVEVFLPCYADETTPINEIQQLFNNVEENIDMIEGSVDFENPYYDGGFHWEAHETNIRKQIYRWIDYTEYVKKRLI